MIKIHLFHSVIDVSGLLCSRAQFWIEPFRNLRNEGHFNGSNEHQSLLQFCFQNILQMDLDVCVELWTKHRIRPSRLAMCPGGVSNELYHLPHRWANQKSAPKTAFHNSELIISMFNKHYYYKKSHCINVSAKYIYTQMYLLAGMDQETVALQLKKMS